MVNNEAWFGIVFAVLFLGILTIPFWIALAIHIQQKILRITRFKFSFLSLIVVYFVLYIFTRLISILMVIVVKTSTFNTDSDIFTSFAFEYFLNPSKSMIIGIIICLVISALVPYFLAKYFKKN